MDSGADIITETLTEIDVPEEVVEETKAAWNHFIGMAATKEAAGEAIYTALFESAPSLQNLFTTPRAVQAMKFMLGIQTLVQSLGDAKGLHVLVETLGFQHLHLDVTPARVVVFRDAIITLFEIEMGDKFSAKASSGLKSLLNYVGGAIIFVRTNYAERLKLLSESWTKCNEMAGIAAAVEQENLGPAPAWTQQMSGDSYSGEGSFSKGDKKEKAGEAVNEAGKTMGDQTLPTTFADMFRMNAAVMGLMNSTWMDEVISQFNNLVSHVSNSNRLKEECDVLSLRLAFYDESEIQLTEFKSCMLAALRSLLPKEWTTKHEVAWTWLWDNVARMLQSNLGKPAAQQKALSAYLAQLEDDTAYEIRRQIYAKFFELAPAGQEYFKQSNTRLHFIAERIFQMTEEIYAEPVRMNREISALGLRHVGFGIPTDLFGPFVTAFCEVIAPMLEDNMVLEAFRWSLGLLAKILVRTITEGSTVVMKAINANSVRQLKRAMSGAARGDRATWLLLVQVGAQSISPLAWAIESGRMDVASAILTDLLSIRADRQSYYFGASELFNRHPDIVKKLCVEAPMILRTLLEGLVWRSHRPKNNMRRVNYYIERVLSNEKREFSEALKYIASMGDPSIMADPLVVLVSDTLWTGIVYRQFLRTKTWNIISLVVFLLSQSVLPRMKVTAGWEVTVNYIILVGKTFTYVLGMGRLGFQQVLDFYIWSRKELKRIFEEIDQDGNGDIDFEEFMEAMGLFKALIREKTTAALSVFFKDDGKKVRIDSNDKKTGQKKSGNMINIWLFATLLAMCITEPMWNCSGSEDFPTNDCEEAEAQGYWYSVFTMCSMAVHWLVIVDLSVFSTELSAFLLVISHVLLEVKQFLIALTFLLLMFASAISISCRDCTDEGGNFNDMANGVISLFAITVRLYQGDFRDMSANPILLTVVLICTTVSAVLLLNLLVAQLNLSYEYIYRDMQGFARLNRASLICDAMNLVSRRTWRKFIATLDFAEKLEFDEGDMGLAGGLQRQEKASLHRTTEETIKRFGGTTSMTAPWPESKDDQEGENRFDRLENMLQKAIKQMSSKRRDGGSGSGAKAGGTSGMMSSIMMSDDGSGSEASSDG